MIPSAKRSSISRYPTPLLRALSLHLLPLVAAVLLACGLARADDLPPVIRWPYFSLPPLFLLSEEAPPGGYGPELQRLAQEQIPGCDHQQVFSLPGRMFEDVQKGEPMVIVGLLKTPEREKHMVYSSLPVRLSFSMHAIVRKADAEHLAPSGTLSLTEVLDNPDITGGFAANLYHGTIQEFLDRNSHRIGLVPVHGTAPLHQLMDMLRLGRIDWFVMDPLIVLHAAKTVGLGRHFALLPLTEYPAETFTGYIACTDAPWCRSAMKRIDAAILEAVRSGRLHDILSPWIPPELAGDFERGYKRHIMDPANSMAKQ